MQRSSWFLLGLVFILGCSENEKKLPEHVKDEFPKTFGLWEVGYQAFEVVDHSRLDRRLAVAAWYPVDDVDIGEGILATYEFVGKYGMTAEIAMKNKLVSQVGGRQLVVFSHGYGGTRFQSTRLLETLASHGFFVIAVEHTGNSQFSSGDDFDTAAKNRVPDVSFVIDEVMQRNQDLGDAFYDRIAKTGIGVVGHSFGGMTALGMAAGWAEAKIDPRVTAIAPISAVIDGNLQKDDRPSPYAGFDESTLSKVEIPVMLLGGTEDVNVPIANNALAFAWLTGNVYRADIRGANHTHFANVCGFGDLLIRNKIGKRLWRLIGAGELIEPYETTCGPEAFPIEEAMALQNLYVVAFFKKHLQGLDDYDLFLEADHVQNEKLPVDYWRK